MDYITSSTGVGKGVISASSVRFPPLAPNLDVVQLAIRSQGFLMDLPLGECHKALRYVLFSIFRLVSLWLGYFKRQGLG